MFGKSKKKVNLNDIKYGQSGSGTFANPSYGGRQQYTDMYGNSQPPVNPYNGNGQQSYNQPSPFSQPVSSEAYAQKNPAPANSAYSSPSYSEPIGATRVESYQDQKKGKKSHKPKDPQEIKHGFKVGYVIFLMLVVLSFIGYIIYCLMAIFKA